MFVSCAKSNGKQYLRLLEGYTIKDDNRVRSQTRTVLGIGRLEEFDDGKPDYVERLKASFKNGKPLIKMLEPYVEPQDAPESNYVVTKNIGSFLLESLYKQLGIHDVLAKYKSNSKIKYDLNGIAKLLVFGRVLNPCSKFATFNQNDDYLLPPASDPNLEDVYKSLDVLSEVSKKIQTRMNTKITDGQIGRDTELVFYDVTNFYYETMYNDIDETIEINNVEVIIKEGARKIGVSKENKHQPLTQMGLFIDDNGIPISYQIFPGNHTDMTTLRPALKSTVDNFNFGRVIVVADRGLNCDKNIAHLVQKGNGYIMSKSIKKNKPAIREWILDQSNYKDKRGKSPDSDTSFKTKSQIVERQIVDENGHKMIIKEKLVSYWSKKHYLKEARQNRAFIDYLDRVIEFPDKLKDKQSKVEYFLKTTLVDKKSGEVLKAKKVHEVNDIKLQEFIDLMGYYLISTSEIHKSDEEIINKYHGLSRIEDSFRITKSNLEGRPVFVRDDEHINAHFLICFIALTMIRLLQYKVLTLNKRNTKTSVDGWEQGITAAKLQKTLATFFVDHQGKFQYKTSEPTEELLELGRAIGVELDLKRPSLERLNKLKNDIGRAKLV